jgi:hypothetical protein
MQFLSLQPFIPSGKNLDLSKKLFQALGFNINWDAGDYVGFGKDGCSFILQQFDDRAFAENLMINVRVSDVNEFRIYILEKKIPEEFGIRVGNVTQQPYGKEVNVIDLAGVCWHFVE